MTRRLCALVSRAATRVALVLMAALAACAPAGAADPLPSRNDHQAKASILSFVQAATTEGGPGFVPPEQRVAVFDNDGTLWSEQPVYFQLMFAIDEVRRMAPGRPQWKQREPFASLLRGDLRKALAGGEKAVGETLMATHAGITTAQFEQRVRAWIASARHPSTGRRYVDMVFQPMLELLAHLRANGFKTYIVSGCGIEFVRAWSEAVYGIPPEQVVGSSVRARFELRDGVPLLVRLPEIDFVNDKGGKPVGIHRHIGRRPVAAFGNSDGDLQMLQWTAAGEGRRLCVLVRHDDAAREWAYDRDSRVCRLREALEEAATRGWTVVSMARDGATVFPGQAVRTAP